MKQGDLETNKEMKVGSWNRDQVTLPKLYWESKDIDIVRGWQRVRNIFPIFIAALLTIAKNRK